MALGSHNCFGSGTSRCGTVDRLLLRAILYLFYSDKFGGDTSGNTHSISYAGYVAAASDGSFVGKGGGGAERHPSADCHQSAIRQHRRFATYGVADAGGVCHLDFLLPDIYFTRQTLRTIPLKSCENSGAQTKRELFSQPYLLSAGASNWGAARK